MYNVILIYEIFLKLYMSINYKCILTCNNKYCNTSLR